jgi:hypothetical protein
MTEGKRMQSERSTQIDFNLHDFIRVRLCSPSPADVKALERQLGPMQSQIAEEPDITIQFVDHLLQASNMRYLGVDEASFDDSGFYVLRTKHKARAKVRIPFEEIGKRLAITCETGLPAVPLLVPIINLTALSKGILPLHASAFTYNQIGVLVTGWSKGGKTETLLAFMMNGASYIGDEWVYIGADGQTIFGIAEPIRLWDWHLHQLPKKYGATIGQGDRVRLKFIKAAEAADNRLPNGVKSGFLPAKWLHRAAPVLKRQLFVDVHPMRLFGQPSFALRGNLDRVFFTMSHEIDAVSVQPAETNEIAQRMVFSLQYERSNFYSYYMMFRFAFPDRRNELIENAEALQRTLLTDLLKGKETYRVYHPYPLSIAALFDTMSPYVSA